MFENANRVGINGYLVDINPARSLPHNLLLLLIACIQGIPLTLALIF